MNFSITLLLDSYIEIKQCKFKVVRGTAISTGAKFFISKVERVLVACCEDN